MVGTVCADVTDPKRQETIGDKKGNRRIAIRFYYPAADAENRKRCELLSEAKRQAFGKKADFRKYDEIINVYEDLPLRDGPFPLILFSHGYGCFMEQNYCLCQFLAENNYIVASIGHPFEAIETIYTDGTRNTYDKSLNKKSMRPFLPALFSSMHLQHKKLTPEEALQSFDEYQRRYEVFTCERINEWAKDDYCALARIHELNEDENSIFYHKIDFSKGVGATGHSFGGDLAYHHCLFNDEVSCGINMDGGLFGDYGEAINHKPFMQMFNKGNLNFMLRARFYHDHPVHYLMFRDMRHMGFTDLKLVSAKEKMVGKADPDLIMNTINQAHLSFFDRYLRQNDSQNASELDIDKEALEDYQIY